MSELASFIFGEVKVSVLAGPPGGPMIGFLCQNGLSELLEKDPQMIVSAMKEAVATIDEITSYLSLCHALSTYGLERANRNALIGALDNQFFTDESKAQIREVLKQRPTEEQIKAMRQAFQSKRDELFLEVIARDGHICQKCDTVQFLQLDHIIPILRGGTNDPDNLQILCSTCNSKKGCKVEATK